MGPRFHTIHNFFEKVDKRDIEDCWQWWGCINKRTGYGCFKINKKQHLAYRFAYEVIVGNVEEGKELHHLCENKSCVNPYHLSLVTRREHVLKFTPTNIMYKRFHNKPTHCLNGHLRSESNLYPNRNCKLCASIKGKIRDKRNSSLKHFLQITKA